MTYNMTAFTETGNPVNWFIIINNYSEGILVTGMILAVFIIMVGIARFNNADTINSMIAASWVTFLISMIAFMITYEGISMVHWLVPMIFGFGAVILVFVKLFR